MTLIKSLKEMLKIGGKDMLNHAQTYATVNRVLHIHTYIHINIQHKALVIDVENVFSNRGKQVIVL